MFPTTNISSLSHILPVRNGLDSFLGENYFPFGKRNCRKPSLEPHLFPYVVSEMFENKYFTKPEGVRVVETAGTEKKETTYNTNNNNANNDSYCNCYYDNYDNNHCLNNVVRVPSMYFFNFKLKMNKNRNNKSIFSIMSWLSERTYRLSANTHRVGGAYKREGYGDKLVSLSTKAVQAVSKAFSHVRWADTRLLIRTCLKRIYGAFIELGGTSSSQSRRSAVASYFGLIKLRLC